MKLTLEVTDTPTEFRYNVLNAICSQLNPRIFVKLKRLEDEVAKQLDPIIRGSEGYKLLMENAEVIGDFGFPQGDTKPYLDAIISTLQKSVTCKFNPFIVSGNKITGGITIGAIFSDFSDILGLSEAKINYYSRRFKGNINLDWLSWLLEKGNKIIVRDFHVEYGMQGRSGEGHMRLGGVWRVSPQISGTRSNNWITRIFKDRDAVEDRLNISIEQFFAGIL